MLRRLNGLFPPGPFLARIPFEGLDLDVPWADEEGRKLAAFGEQDADIARFLAAALHHAASVPGRNRVIDAGANLGSFSLSLAARHGARVDAFEPQPALAALLAANAARNGVADRIRVHALALGTAEGEACLHLPDGVSGAARIEPENPSDPSSSSTKIVVPIRRLDTEISPEAWRETAVMKIDVEGFEGEVFAGASALFPLRRPPLVFELNLVEMAWRGRQPSELRRALEAVGYRDFHALDRVLYPVGNGVYPVSNIVALSAEDAALREKVGYDARFRPRPRRQWPVKTVDWE